MKVAIVVEEDARKHSYPGEVAWQLLADADKVVVAVGKKVVEFDPTTVDRDLFLKKVIGPSGNLRAPALRIGKVFYIGYNTKIYKELLLKQ
jgi:hypothetical protein